MKRLHVKFAAGLMVLACTAMGKALADHKIIVQSTTSTKNSGLYDYILPMVKQDTGVTANIVAVGTGAAIKNAMNCDGDVLLVHSRKREDKFVAEGYASQRYDLMYNDYVIIGPRSDPAGIAGMRDAAAAVKQGVLLVVDYALEADRYYTCQRSDGTLLAYHEQIATNEVLRNAGTQDITAHLCVEGVVATAEMNGWKFEGQRRQGEALLALGLADRFSALQSLPADQLEEALRRRETLLRLVDPSCLGDLRWMVFHRQNCHQEDSPAPCSRFLRDPSPVTAGS